jgi:hypothetical protein
MTVHKADARTRRVLLWTVLALCGLALGAAYALWMFSAQVGALLIDDPERAEVMLRTLHRVLIGLLVLQMVILGIYLFRRATQVCRLQQFPLPGSRTVFNQHVRYGESAIRMGRVGQVAALLLLILAVVAFWMVLL